MEKAGHGSGLFAAEFAYTYVSLDGTTDFYLEKNSPSFYDLEFPFVLLYFPEYKASSAEEFIEKLNRNGIDHPITNEPIILEDSPGSFVWKKSGDEIKIKYCGRNGSLINLQ